uniref:Uncharacterized protein n=1 Tax=Mimivirus LCMiAC01 TaxID=2506608 RepID=A0A481Z120_9VIRU|nr:MAG: uncharacterized protein LCMiAC01_05430 [Mimivirus LCMiAC01]
MVKYRLVNPHIEGNIKTTFDKKSPIDAARAVWKTISKYVTNVVPKFAFTLECVNGKCLHHYLVKESAHNDMVDYEITKLNVKKNSKNIKQFKKRYNKFKNKMTGGYVDDDDDDYDDDDIATIMLLRKIRSADQPIVTWWYNPQIYRLGNIFIPTFEVPLIPYIYIDMPQVLYY